MFWVMNESHAEMLTPNPVLINQFSHTFIYPFVDRNKPTCFTVITALISLPHICSSSFQALNSIFFSVSLQIYTFSYCVLFLTANFALWAESMTNFSHTHPFNISHDKLHDRLHTPTSCSFRLSRWALQIVHIVHECPQTVNMICD